MSFFKNYKSKYEVVASETFDVSKMHGFTSDYKRTGSSDGRPATHWEPEEPATEEFKVNSIELEEVDPKFMVIKKGDKIKGKFDLNLGGELDLEVEMDDVVDDVEITGDDSLTLKFKNLHAEWQGQYHRQTKRERDEESFTG